MPAPGQYIFEVIAKGRPYYYFRPSAAMARMGMKRVALGGNREAAAAAVTVLLASISTSQPDRDITPFLRVARKMLSNAKQRAKKRRVPCTITADEVALLLTKQKLKCAVSSLAFDLEKTPGRDEYRRPFSPSLDRLDNAGGYTAANCRLVCSAVNYAMGEWGEAVLLKIALAVVQKKLRAADELQNFCKTANGPETGPVSP